MKHFSWLVLVAVLSIAGIGSLHADTAQSAGAPTEDSAKALALQWFLKLQAGKIDRAQYAPAYGALLTDDAVKAMSHHLNEYGASPTSAEILQSRSAGTQRFYMVKLLFPRGDAASILFGLDSDSKITAISIVTMAGD